MKLLRWLGFFPVMWCFMAGGNYVLSAENDPVLTLLNDRFEVTLVWNDVESNPYNLNSEVLNGTANGEKLADDMGYFWFHSKSNIEVFVHIIDGTPVNDHFWVFATALTNTEFTLTVKDTTTDTIKTYFNPQGNFAPTIADTSAFGSNQKNGTIEQEQTVSSKADDTLFLHESRFSLTVDWKTAESTGSGIPVSLQGEESGYFYFFNPANPELIVKILDGTEVNGNYWVFVGALTNVEYTLTVTDTQTGKTVSYSSPYGQLAAPIGDRNPFGKFYDYYGVHIAQASPWVNKIKVFNNARSTEAADLEIFDCDGQSMFTDSYHLDPHQTQTFVLTNNDEYIPNEDEVVVDDMGCSFKITTDSPRIKSLVSYQYGDSKSISQFLLNGELSTEYFIPNTVLDYFTWAGVAVMNPFPDPIDVTFEAFRQGVMMDSSLITIQPYQRYVGLSSGIWDGVDYGDFDQIRISSDDFFATPILISGDDPKDRILFFNGVSTSP